MIYANFKSPLGNLTAAAEGNGITGLWFEGQKYFPGNTNSWIYEPEHPVFIRLHQWLENYFKGNKDATLPDLQPKGTDFQKAVWKILLQIPYGTVTTYGEIAKKIAASRGQDTMSAQAVGGAVGHNPVSILIPCHRVVGTNGSLTGYAGGLDRKKALLQLEQEALARK
ncbi:methylated-DNA--[protein]-cysteine S-methyltransferase [Lacrimispora sp. JR3]|uniref:methylated-DNA--[protein]-cysteine S-methyltransferase n=1 Tax=Lacrimispora sinapis TaxID=3111456 RepID=UPI00374A3E3F